MSVSKFGSAILTSKYTDKDAGESQPEDVFDRVSCVLAIPDLYYEIMDLGLSVDAGNIKKILIGSHIGQAKIDTLLGLYDLVKSRDKYKHKASTDEIDINKLSKYFSERRNKYYAGMLSCDLLPATPTLLNAGRTGMLSSCFFLRVPDSLDGIFETLRKSASVLKSGGGIGFDFSDIRPKGSKVKGTNGVSSGPVEYMEIYNSMGDTINQGGIRKAAMLTSINISHPDVVRFIKCKTEEGKLANFNISVMINNKFMVEAKNKVHTPWVCNFGGVSYRIRKSDDTPVLSKSKKGDYYSAFEILTLISEKSWKNGEPGVIFEDKLNSGDVYNGKYGKYGVNPCGELPLLDGESCNLAAINLSNFVFTNDNGETNIDWDNLGYYVKLGVTLLDNVVSLNNYPLKEIEQMTLRTRKIGLGTMGLHDLLLKFETGYGSKKSLSIINKVYTFIRNAAEEQTKHLASVRGGLDDFPERRNSHILTVQPTGTLANLAGCSYGIEPNFLWTYERKSKEYGDVIINHPILNKKGGIPEYAKTSLEIRYEDHILVQSEVQKHIDSSISKTINSIIVVILTLVICSSPIILSAISSYTYSNLSINVPSL